jgi:hypothetical protein
MLPKLGKAFDKGLSSGTYDVEQSVPIRQAGTVTDGKSAGIIPLLELCFRQETKLTWKLKHPCDPTLVFYCRTFLYMCKKIELPAQDSVVKQCESDFFTLDTMVLPSWYDDNFSSHLYTKSRLESLIQSVAARVIPTVFPLWDDLVPKHGPGAVSDLSIRRADKFSFPTWSDHLHSWFPYNEFAFHKYTEGNKPSKEPIAKVCSVPKTLDKVRVITVEPSSNQFMQQALRHFLVTRKTAIASRCIDFSDQEKSKMAAKEASIDGSSATIDLRSASDYLSLALVKHIFSVNPILLDMLLACRTRKVQNPSGENILLRKYAGQGNATTFAVQSLCYTVLAIVASLVEQGPRTTSNLNRSMIEKAARKVRVFGDDIIIPSQNVVSFYHILKSVGLTPNHDKSHVEGFFREACGGITSTDVM